MSGGLTEAKSFRRLTQAFRMAALCCSLGSVTRVSPPRQVFYSRWCAPKRPLPEFSNVRQRSAKESRLQPGVLAMARQPKPWLLRAATRAC
jgi:hypothetical protein